MFSEKVINPTDPPDIVISRRTIMGYIITFGRQEDSTQDPQPVPLQEIDKLVNELNLSFGPQHVRDFIKARAEMGDLEINIEADTVVYKGLLKPEWFLPESPSNESQV